MKYGTGLDADEPAIWLINLVAKIAKAPSADAIEKCPVDHCLKMLDPTMRAIPARSIMGLFLKGFMLGLIAAKTNGATEFDLHVGQERIAMQKLMSPDLGPNPFPFRA